MGDIEDLRGQGFDDYQIAWAVLDYAVEAAEDSDVGPVTFLSMLAANLVNDGDLDEDDVGMALEEVIGERV
jgi:hypothetical protein